MRVSGHQSVSSRGHSGLPGDVVSCAGSSVRFGYNERGVTAATDLTRRRPRSPTTKRFDDELELAALSGYVRAEGRRRQ